MSRSLYSLDDPPVLNLDLKSFLCLLMPPLARALGEVKAVVALLNELGAALANDSFEKQGPLVHTSSIAVIRHLIYPFRQLSFLFNLNA